MNEKLIFNCTWGRDEPERAPAVHRLVADTQVVSDVLDAASGRDKVQHPLTKLRRVTASSRAVLQCLGGTAALPIPIIRL